MSDYYDRALTAIAARFGVSPTYVSALAYGQRRVDAGGPIQRKAA